MARRGPRPKPIEQKRREAGSRVSLPGVKTRQIPDPIVHGGRPVGLVAPRDLEPGEADVWRMVVPHLEAGGLLDVVDEVALRNLCLCVDAIRQARAQLVDEGWYVKSPNGYKIAHPAVGIVRQFLAEFRQWSDRFGLDPSSRAALVGAGVKTPTRDVDDEDQVPAKLRAV